MDLPCHSIEHARARGLLRNVRTFEEVEPELFLVRGKRPFYVSATRHDMLSTGLREAPSECSYL